MKEDNLLSLSYGNIVNKDINTSDGLLPESFETYQIVKPGDIVLRLTDLQNDKRSLRSALVTQTGIITSAYLALKPEGIDPKYLGYLLRAYDVSKVFYSMGGGLRQSMKYGDIKRMPLVMPTKAEQSEIASFLDRETAKIDALITEQQRLIELLQEKRQAVISHAVTKGLNPNAPMKVSGVEWLGEVPEHWEVRKLSQLCAGIGSGTTPKSDRLEFYEDGTIPWVVTGDLNDSMLDECSNRVTDRAINEHSTLKLYEAGSVVVAMYGATIGKAALLGIAVTVNQACCVLPPSREVRSEYLLLFVLAARPHLLSLATGGGQPNINQEVIRSLRMPLPAVSEQEDIVRQVRSSLGGVDSVSSMASKQVELLQERRSALISAAVTGQIDVRGLVPEAAEQ